MIAHYPIRISLVVMWIAVKWIIKNKDDLKFLFLYLITHLKQLISIISLFTEFILVKLKKSPLKVMAKPPKFEKRSIGKIWEIMGRKIMKLS